MGHPRQTPRQRITPILAAMHPETHLPSALAQFGFATLTDVLTPQRVADLQAQAALLSPAAARNTLDLPWCQALARELAALSPVREALQAGVGPDAVAVQCTLFDKSAERNWLVAWHQDLSLPLAERHDSAGWSGWSSKHGVVFAQPPVALLARVLALRLHLDDCGPEDGALRVRAGSHLGELRMHMPGDAATRGFEDAHEVTTAQALAAMGKTPPNVDMQGVPGLAQPVHAAADPFAHQRTHTAGSLADPAPSLPDQLCPVPAGGALLMRPLLQHASSKSSSGKPRRVLHFVFAPRALPHPLRWRWSA